MPTRPVPIRRRWLLLLLCGAVAALAVASVLHATRRWGPGLSPDSASYIGAARNIMAGRGVLTLDRMGGETPMTHFPPFFSFMLATVGAAGGLDPIEAAGLTNALLFALNVFLAGWAVWRISGGSALAAAVASLWLLTEEDMMNVHVMAWTEPTLIAATLGGFLLLERYFETERRPWLVASGLVMACGILARYAGFSLIPAAALAVLWAGPGRWRRRLADAVLHGVATLGPMLLWMGRNALVAGEPTDRPLAWHPPNPRHWKTALQTVETWLAPRDLPGGWATPAIVLFLALIALALTWDLQTAPGRRDERGRPARGRGLSPWLIFSIGYFLFLLVSISFFDHMTPLNGRLLIVMRVTLTVWLVGQTAAFLRAAGSRLIALALTLAALALAGYHAPRAWKVVRDSDRNGRGMNSPYWRQTKGMDFIRRQPRDAIVYANNVWAVYLQLGRPAHHPPRTYNPYSLEPNENLEADMAEARRDFQERGAVLVLFRHGGWHNFWPKRLPFMIEMGIAPMQQGARARRVGDATVYSVTKNARQNE